MDAAGPIPFAMELYDKGVITKNDADGLELNWGNESAVHQMITNIAHRRGFGNILAEGSVRAAQKIGKGAEKCLTTIKGMEMFGSADPRTASWIVSLGSLTGLRGGDDLDTTHTLGLPYSFPGWAREAGWSEEKYLQWLLDWLDMPADLKEKIFGASPTIQFFSPDNPDGKAALVKWHGDCTSLCNSLGLCLFVTNSSLALGPTHFAALYSACTGWDVKASEMMKIGERIFNFTKAYSVREGFSRKDDDFPERFYRDPWPSGPFKGCIARREKVNKILDEYYELRGWDKKRGVPTKKKLLELGLDDVAIELSKHTLIEG
jgi:aldehyde:ferredoxin oxidoreductase